MIGLLFGLAILISLFRSKSRLEAENAVLRHQLIVLRRKMRGRPQLTKTTTAGSLSSCIAGFRPSCRFSQSSGPTPSCVCIGPAFAVIGDGSRALGEGGHRSIPKLRVLIRRMSVENP